jgi:hypothetical protein
VTLRFMINPYAQPTLALAAGAKEPDGVQNATGQSAEGRKPLSLSDHGGLCRVDAAYVARFWPSSSR